MEKRNLDITRLDNCIRILVQGVKLPPHFENHSLSGNWASLFPSAPFLGGLAVMAGFTKGLQVTLVPE